MWGTGICGTPAGGQQRPMSWDWRPGQRTASPAPWFAASAPPFGTPRPAVERPFLRNENRTKRLLSDSFREARKTEQKPAVPCGAAAALVRLCVQTEARKAEKSLPLLAVHDVFKREAERRRVVLSSRCPQQNSGAKISNVLKKRRKKARGKPAFPRTAAREQCRQERRSC